MSEYYDALICNNGHCINSRYEPNYDSCAKFCSKCGAATINICPNCHALIRGKMKDSGFIDITPYNVPHYCYNCGAPYPWTASAIQAASDMICEDNQMSQDQKDKLISSLPDIISQTPKTQLAANRFKKAFSIAGHFTADFLRQFALDFGSELALKLLGLK